MEELRSSTKNNHLELDRYIYPLIKKVDTAEAYHKLLAVFYGFYKPLQDKLEGYLNEENVPAYATRRKAERILKDLDATDTNNNIRLCDELPKITSLSQALGAFYVIEGSTLGGKFIADKIKENLSAQAGRDFTFFDAYGENNLQMWSSFTTKLNNTDVDSTELISTATNTFDKFYSWIKGNYE
jgi:heme oxygenase